MIRQLMSAALLSVALALPTGASAQNQKSFARDDLASQAIRLEQALKSEASGSINGRTAQQLRKDGDIHLSQGRPQNAMALYAAAIAAEPGNETNWLGYARAALAVTPSNNWEERTKLQERRATAAYIAYQKAKNAAGEAAALAVLGEVYAAQNAWRPSLNAYAASLKARENPDIRMTYETLRAEHGFRILDYKVDSDAASPRVCFQFSDPLAAKVDFAPYLTVSGVSNAAVSADGSQLCVDGLKHSERYTFLLRQGLPSSVGENLLHPIENEIYIRDRAPQVRFTGRNYVLPSTGQEGIPVVSVNTAKVDVRIYRIGDRSLVPTVHSYEFLQQLESYSAAKIGRETGFKVWNGTLDTPSALNQEMITAFPVTDAVGRMEPGVYVMTAKPNDGSPVTDESDEEDYESLATQWFVVSDLGLTAFTGKTGVQVFVRSLASANPVADVEVRLVAKNNEILATKKTNGMGVATFDPGLARGEGGLAPGLAVAAIGSDYGFLNLETAAFDLSDRGVKGRSAETAVDAFLYTERGVYRTGETVQLSALLRDSRGIAVQNLPLTLVVRRPDGVEYRRAQVEDQGLGGRAFSIPILPGSLRGTWRVAAYTDPKGSPVGQVTFLVEDYVPERLEVNLTPKGQALRPGEEAAIDISARYLYGSPGSGLNVSGEVTVAEAETSGIKGLEGFAIGLGDQSVEASTTEIETPAVTDDKGHVVMQIPVQEVEATRPTQARITLRVAEPGGRAVERSVTLPILPSGPVVGVKKLFGELSEGANASFDVVLAKPDGQRLASRGVSWTLYKIERRYQWYRSGGSWSYEPVKNPRRIADGTLAVTENAPARIKAPVEWGTYRLDVSAPDLGETAQTSVSFTVGWSGDQTAETPDLLEMNLDKASYAAGETIRLHLNPRFAGKATLAVVSDRVHDIRVVDVAASGADISIPVKAEWGPGAYVIGMMHRPLDQTAKRMPGRALGTAWFEINHEARSLTVSLNTPDKIAPRTSLNLPIKVTGLQPGEEARITVAAVDVGILNLTRYQAPQPFEYFFGQKSLAMDIRDLYAYLIDGMQGTRGAIRSGGDGAAPALSDIPPTQEPFARFSGVVKVEQDGSANITFDVPGFNGTARIMAVAWTKDRVGSASQDIVIRDPVVLAGTLPRFLAIGDQSRFFLQIDNVEGPSGTYEVSLNVNGPVTVAPNALRTSLKLDAKSKGSFNAPLTAKGVGQAVIDVSLKGPNMEPVTQSFTVAIQPGTSSMAYRVVRPIDPGSSITLSKDAMANILESTGAAAVSVSTLAALDVPGLLKSLDRYPYGCTEQTVSRALPLLYVNRLAREERLSLDEKADERVRGAIDRILVRQASDGSFGLWGVGGEDLWLDAYATDFLTRARENGFAVPQSALTIALDRLRNFVANTTEVEEKASDIAYAAYVLARNGRPVMGDLRYLADTKIDAFASPLARAQLAAALALLGDRGRAQITFGNAVKGLQAANDTGNYRHDYGSRLRDGAGLLALASETDNAAALLRPVANIIAQERGSRRTSTQEEAWLVLASQAVSRDAGGMRLNVDGADQQGPFYSTYRDTALASKPIRIVNNGRDIVQAVITVTGNPIDPEPAVAHGYAIERTYHKLDGTPVQPNKVRQNDRLVVVLKVTEPEAKQARLLLVDRIPAGFEIDNPNLVDSNTTANLSWLGVSPEPAHTEYRDDRLVAAFDRDSNQSATFSIAYMVRVVSPGQYVHPAAHVEDMYRPERYGRTGYGKVEVLTAQP